MEKKSATSPGLGRADRTGSLRQLAFDIGLEHISHAAPGRGHGHVNSDFVAALNWHDLATVDESEINDIDRNFRDAVRDNEFSYEIRNPMFDFVRSDPRYIEMMRGIGLPP